MLNWSDLQDGIVSSFFYLSKQLFKSTYLTPFICVFQMKAGFVINIVSVFILCLSLNSFIYPVFDLGNIPDAFLSNTTSVVTQAAGVVNASLTYNITNGASWKTELHEKKKNAYRLTKDLDQIRHLLCSRRSLQKEREHQNIQQYLGCVFFSS